jgi:hypothetical protein
LAFAPSGSAFGLGHLLGSSLLEFAVLGHLHGIQVGQLCGVISVYPAFSATLTVEADLGATVSVEADLGAAIAVGCASS